MLGRFYHHQTHQDSHDLGHPDYTWGPNHLRACQDAIVHWHLQYTYHLPNIHNTSGHGGCKSMLPFPLHTCRLNWHFWFPSRGLLQSGYHDGLWIYCLRIKLEAVLVCHPSPVSCIRALLWSHQKHRKFLDTISWATLDPAPDLHGGRDDSIFSAIHEKCSLKLRQDGNSCWILQNCATESRQASWKTLFTYSFICRILYTDSQICENNFLSNYLILLFCFSCGHKMSLK